MKNLRMTAAFYAVGIGLAFSEDEDTINKFLEEKI